MKVIRRGDMITASVAGSDYEPYRVTLEFDDTGIRDAGCTCPYDWGGWCKHLVAVVLALLHEADAIEERPAVDALLQDLDADQLYVLLEELVKRHPDILDDIEAQLPLLRMQPADTLASDSVLPSESPMSPRRLVQSLLRGGRGYYTTAFFQPSGSDTGPSNTQLYRAWALIQAGDGNSALAALDALTKMRIHDWLQIEGWDDEGEDFEEIGWLWTEAVLSAELGDAERRVWEKKLRRWQDALDDYGLEDVFVTAIEALQQGWDYPPLLRVFAGEITEKGAWEDEAPYHADALVIARLNVLERQGRYEDYLNLALAEGNFLYHLLMLARLNRVQALMETIEQYPCSLDEAFLVAQALHEYGHPEAALDLAQRALTFNSPDYQKGQLSAWLSELAEAMGYTEIASATAVTAFEVAPTLASYERALALAEDQQVVLRERLLDELRARPPSGSRDIIEIFLHEGLVDDAINALGPYAYYDTVRLVADAAISTHPEWVIEACRKQAEPIMDEGKAKYYYRAADWLAKARDAYRVAGREAEWRRYLDSLLEKHGRKYKLVPMLKALK